MVTVLLPLFVDRTLRAARAFLPAFKKSDLTCDLSRRERLGLILSAIERCGADCPACVIWALEQERSQAAFDTEPADRRLP